MQFPTPKSQTDFVLKELRKLYPTLSFSQSNNITEALKVLDPYAPVRGNPSAWAPLDLQNLYTALANEISYRLQYPKPKYNVWLFNKYMGPEIKFLPLNSVESFINLIYYQLAVHLLMRPPSTSMIENFNKVISKQDYGTDTKQLYYDVMEMIYSETITSVTGGFGSMPNELLILMEVSELLYNPDSDYYRLGFDLDRLYINWRLIPKIARYGRDDFKPDRVYGSETVDLFLKYIEDTVRTGGVTSDKNPQEELDDEDRLAGRLVPECDSQSYLDLRSKASDLFIDMPLDNICEIIESHTTEKYPFELEGSCADYDKMDLFMVYIKILNRLSKRQLCKIINDNQKFTKRKY